MNLMQLVSLFRAVASDMPIEIRFSQRAERIDAHRLGLFLGQGLVPYENENIGNRIGLIRQFGFANGNDRNFRVYLNSSLDKSTFAENIWRAVDMVEVLENHPLKGLNSGREQKRVDVVDRLCRDILTREFSDTLGSFMARMTTRVIRYGWFAPAHHVLHLLFTIETYGDFSVYLDGTTGLVFSDANLEMPYERYTPALVHQVFMIKLEKMLS